jgi:ribonucleoside-diphosphate reductase alpha chain
MRFEPMGMTDDPDIRFAASIMDYLFRRLALEYLTYDERAELGIFSIDERMQPTLPGVEESTIATSNGTELATDPKSIPSASELAAQLELDATNESGASAGAAPGAASAANPASSSTRPVQPAGGTPSAVEHGGHVAHADAPMCMQCGVQMVRAGACHVCPSCGTTSGCS